MQLCTSSVEDYHYVTLYKWSDKRNSLLLWHVTYLLAYILGSWMFSWYVFIGKLMVCDWWDWSYTIMGSQVCCVFSNFSVHIIIDLCQIKVVWGLLIYRSAQSYIAVPKLFLSVGCGPPGTASSCVMGNPALMQVYRKHPLPLHCRTATGPKPW